MRRNNPSAVYLATLSVDVILFLLLHILQELKYAWTLPYFIPCILVGLLMMDWSKRGNINTPALVTTARCNALVELCSKQLLGPTRHFIGHFGNDFYRSDDPTNSVKALKEFSWPL